MPMSEPVPSDDLSDIDAVLQGFKGVLRSLRRDCSSDAEALHRFVEVAPMAGIEIAVTGMGRALQHLLATEQAHGCEAPHV